MNQADRVYIVPLKTNADPATRAHMRSRVAQDDNGLGVGLLYWGKPVLLISYISITSGFRRHRVARRDLCRRSCLRDRQSLRGRLYRRQGRAAF